MASKTFNVGIIGYGLSTKVFQIPLILVTPTLKLHAIVQRTPKPDNDASKDHPGVKIYQDTQDLFSDASIDIIVISSTPDTHFAFTKLALENGKHVMVEKPFVPLSSEGEELLSISRKTGKLICVYQNRRWDSDFLTFRKLQAEGTLGRIVEFETHFDRWKPTPPVGWKGELSMKHAGGVIYDLGTHLLDQAVVAFGSPDSVTGIFVNQRDDGGEEPDSFIVLLRYGSGLVVTAKAGVINAVTENLRFWVKGTKGSYLKHHLDCQEDQLKAGSKPGDAGFGVESEDKSGILTVVGDSGFEKKVLKNVEPETYAQIYSQFAKAIEEGDENLVPVKVGEAVTVLKIIETAIESAKTGKTIAFSEK